jgi:hypothetical protein
MKIRSLLTRRRAPRGHAQARAAIGPALACHRGATFGLALGVALGCALELGAPTPARAAQDYTILPVPLAGEALVVAQRAYREYAQHQYTRSAADAREAIRQRPDLARLRILLADALQANGERAQARRALTDAIAQLGPQAALTARRRQLDTLIASAEAPATNTATAGGSAELSGPAFEFAKQAYADYDKKDFAAAVNHVRQAIALRPDVLRLHLLLIDALGGAGQDVQAYQADLDAQQRFGDNDDLRLRRVFIGTRLAPNFSTQALQASASGELARASQLAGQAIAYAPPDRISYRLQLIQLLLRQNDLAHVELQASQAITQDDTQIMAWVLRGYVRAVHGDAQGSESDFAQALKIEDANLIDRRLARVIIADIWLAQGHAQRAIDLLTPLKVLGDEADPMLADRLHRARMQLAQGTGVGTGSVISGPLIANGPSLASTALPAPQISCVADVTGAACQVYPADAGFDAQREVYAATQRNDTKAAVAAARAAVAAAPEVPQHRVDLINALTSANDQAGATRAARAAIADGMLEGMPALSAAYIAARAGEGKVALAHFQQAEAQGALPPGAKADVAYAAIQAHENKIAATYLEAAIDTGLTPPEGTPAATPTQLLDERSAHADVTRNWGATTSLTYRGQQDGSSLGAPPTQGATANNNYQASSEVYWRPFGSLNDRLLEVYARDSESFGVQSGPSGNATNQVALGVRAKPFSTLNAIFALEHISPIGAAARNDWLGRAAYSSGLGTERRTDVPSWWTVSVYAEAGHYLVNPSTYATAFIEAGRSYRIDSVSPRLVVFPFLVAGADYDSSINHSVPLGVGAGVSTRYYFREDKYNTPRSYVELSLQYRFHVLGDVRGRGPVLGSTFSY